MKFYIPLITSLCILGCQHLPTSGPSTNKVLEINESASEQKGLPEVNIVELDQSTVDHLQYQQKTQFFSGLSNIDSHKQAYNGVANVGDILDISIWEAPPAVLFGGTFNSEGQGSGNLTKLPPQMINQNGTVNVPFVGNIHVAGKSPEHIQDYITNALKRKANQPQVLVKIASNLSSDVTIIRKGSAIRMPLTANNERVLDAIAAVGGSSDTIEDITVQLTRGNQVKTLAFETLISDPSQNIALRAGDIVSLLNTPFKFTGLGALGNNQQMRFSSKGITLAEAIGRMGGLIDNRSDPRGIFVFRHIPFEQLQPEQQTKWKTKGYNSGMNVPTVFNINLLEPHSVFLMQRFPVLDKDIVYVSNAPLAEFQKFLRMIFSITSPITSTTNTIRGF